MHDLCISLHCSVACIPSDQHISLVLSTVPLIFSHGYPIHLRAQENSGSLHGLVGQDDLARTKLNAVIQALNDLLMKRPSSLSGVLFRKVCYSFSIG